VVADGAALEPYCHVLNGSILPRAMGAFSYSFAKLDMDMMIGRYASISWDVTAMGSAHPDDWASSHPFSHNPGPLWGVRTYLKDVAADRFPVLPFERGDQSIHIGHDVWIGAGTMIKRGVTIRYRFAEPVIERLLASEWWRYGPDVLQGLDIRDPSGFLDRLAEKAGRGAIAALDLKPLTTAEIVEAAKGG
jgi:hypothetical protein